MSHTDLDTEPTPGTYALEDQLPRVPLPTLDATAERFIEWCAPLLTAEQLAETEAALADFLRPDGTGRRLHAELAAYDASEGVHSWLDTFWPYRYLGRRDRIALNANFFFLFDDPAPDRETPAGTGAAAGAAGDEGADDPQARRAAGLIAAALHYKLRLDAGRVEPVLQRGRPLSMEQNKYLFSATRIPGAVLDTVRLADSEGTAGARHVIVFHRGTMFRMEVLGPDGAPHTLAELRAGLAAVRTAGAEPAAPGTSVGHLTTKARAAWAADRQALLALDPRNAAALEEIETALFCVCLEDLAPADALAAGDQLLHGDSGNRWFDKAVSFVVFADGQAGINVEHCGLDGTTVLSFVDALLGSPAAEQSAASGARAQGEPAVRPVEFVLDGPLRAAVTEAAADFARYAADTATTTVAFDDFGADAAKALRCSPDAFVQLAYQLAHQRAKGMLGTTYESIATRQYRRGRTEAMRVVTPEIQRFVAAMEDPDAGPDARRAAFRAAAERHVARARACQQGEAPEQHLWELQLLDQRRGVEPHPLYRSPGWLVMRDDYLSTSSAPSVNIRYFGFGSTSSRCIGIAYVLLPDRFHVYLSTPRPVAAQMHAFASRLREAVAELRELLAAEPA